MIIVALSYSFMDDRFKGSSEPPPVAQMTASPTPDSTAQETAPVVTATPEATESPIPSPTVTSEATPTPEPKREENVETQAPVPTETPSPDEGSSQVADSGSVSGLPSDDQASGTTVTLNFGGDVIFRGKPGNCSKRKVTTIRMPRSMECSRRMT